MAVEALRITGDTQSAERAVARLEQRVEKLSTKLRDQSRFGKQSAKDQERGFNAVAGSIGSAAVKLVAVDRIYAGIQNTIRGAFETNKQFADSVSQLFERLEEEELKLQIQGGFTPDQIKSQIPNVQQALLTTPSATTAQGLQLQTQLVSSGFREKDVESGQALLAALDIKSITNQFGRTVSDAAEPVKTLSQFLKGLGVADPSASNIRESGFRVTSLFAGSDIQFSDLGDLAKVAAPLKGLGLSENVQLASFSALRDIMPAGEAATGLRQVSSRLRGATLSGKKVDALESVGLSPEDVDLIGESFPEALKRLNDALNKVGEGQKSQVLLTLFGEKGQAAGSSLLSLTQSGTIESRLKVLDSAVEESEKRLKIFRESAFARGQRIQLRTDFAKRQETIDSGGLTFENIRQLQELKFAEDRLEGGGIGAGVKAFIGRSVISAREKLGLSAAGLTPDPEAIQRGGEFFGAGPGFQPLEFKDARQQAQAGGQVGRQNGVLEQQQRAVQVEGQQKLVELMERQNELLEQQQQPPIDRNATAVEQATGGVF